MKSKKTIIGVVLAILAFSIFLISYSPKQQSFSDTVLIKMNMPLKGESISNIKITNTEETREDFKISFSNLEGFVKVDNNDFILDSEESTNIKIFIKDSKEEVGVYSGELIIQSAGRTERIPIILGVENPNSFFTIISHSLPEYEKVYPGGKFGAEIKLFDLVGTDLQTINSKNYIKNSKGDVVWSDEGNLVVGGSKVEIINIPENWPVGSYVFISIVEYKGVKTVASQLINISQKENFGSSENTKLVIMVLVLFFIGIIIMFIYFTKTRDSLIIELKRQQDRELKRNLEVIKISNQIQAVLKDEVLKALKQMEKDEKTS